MNSSLSLTYPMPYTWRAARRDDIPAIVQSMTTAVSIDGLDAPPPAEEFDRVFDQLGADVETDSLVASTPDGQLAVFAVMFMPPSDERHSLQLSGHVDVAFRQRGLGTFVLQWAQARAQQKLAQFTDDKPRTLSMGCREHQKDRVNLFEQAGFQPVRYFYKMERDLSQSIPDKPLADGLAVCQWRPELDEATRVAFNDSFRDHWNFFPADETIWQRWFTGTPDFRGDLSYLVLDGERVAGFTICSHNQQWNEQAGKNEGWLNDIGVIRDWRKRGVASAVIVASLRAFRAAGLAVAALGVDTQNPSGALRLYEGLGFTAVRRNITFSKTIGS